MTGYLIRRIFQMIVVIFFSALFTFWLFNIAPGGPLSGLRQSQVRLKPTDIARIRAKYELDLYLPVRFSRWLIGFPTGAITLGGQEVLANVPIGCYLADTHGGCADYVYLAELPTLHPPIKSSKGIFRGDFGPSTKIAAGRPASAQLLSRLGPTMELMLSSTLLSILIGVPLGIYSAVRQYSRFDYATTTIAFVGSSMPTFFFGLLLILILSVIPNLAQDTWPWLPSLPPGLRLAVRPYEIATWLPKVAPGTLTDRLLHLFMPLTVLTFFGVATWSRFVRSSMLEVMRQDYVRTARAKGLIENVVIMKHALRNALIPFVTVLVLQIPNIFGGAIITETVFAWPGMGGLFFNALQQSDWPIALAFVFITAVLTVIATLLGLRHGLHLCGRAFPERRALQRAGFVQCDDPRHRRTGREYHLPRAPPADLHEGRRHRLPRPLHGPVSLRHRRRPHPRALLPPAEEGDDVERACLPGCSLSVCARLAEQGKKEGRQSHC